MSVQASGPPYVVSVPTLLHLAPVFLPLSLFPGDPALLVVRDNLIHQASQGHPDPQLLPPSDKKLMNGDNRMF